MARPPLGFQELEELKVSLEVLGDAWTALRRERSPLCGYIEVIVRCTPNHKVSCTDYHVQRSAITLMCGGGHDLIVSPFTSVDKSLFVHRWMPLRKGAAAWRRPSRSTIS